MGTSGHDDLPAHTDVVVVGAGVMGASAAYRLTQRGVTVTVIEREGIAAGASGRNGGIVSGSVSGTDRSDQGLGPYLALSMQLLRAFPDELDADIQLRLSGSLGVALTPSELTYLQQVAATFGAGATARLVDEYEARVLVPALAPQVLGGLFFPHDGHLWPFALNHALADAAMRQGARFVLGTEVTTIEVDAGRVQAVHTARGRIACQWVVLAVNPWTALLARTAGLHLPLQPVRGQVLATLAAPPLLPMPLWREVGRSSLYWRQTPGGQIVMGGGRYFDTGGVGSFDRAVTREVVHLYARGIAATVPALNDLTVARMWAGTMGYTPDHRPLIGPSRQIDGLVVAQACNGSGMPWVGITGLLVAEAIVGTTPSLPLDPLNPDRWHNREYQFNPADPLPSDEELVGSSAVAARRA